MGLSFNDQESMLKVTSSLYFVSDDWKSISEESDIINEQDVDIVKINMYSP